MKCHFLHLPQRRRIVPGVAAAVSWVASLQMNWAYVVTAELSLAACVLPQTACLWLCPFGRQIGVFADDYGGAVSIGFYLVQTDRTWRRSSGVLGGKFADELGVCRGSRTVTCGMCFTADDYLLLRNFEWGTKRMKTEWYGTAASCG
jgi:hypothetical protein